MRKGYSIIELLVVMIVFVMISVPLSRFTVAVFRDVPRQYRHRQDMEQVDSLIDRISRDMAGADSFEARRTSLSDLLLIINRDGESIKYVRVRDGFQRWVGGQSQSWACGDGRISMETVEVGRGVKALAVRGWVEKTVYKGKVVNSYSQSHLLFCGVLK